MQIEKMLQPNCSEIVHQIVGVTSEVAEDMKGKFINRLGYKYNLKYITDYATALFTVEGKYCLNLADCEGDNKDWEIIKEIASELGYFPETVSYTSDRIIDDDGMESYIKWMKETNNGSN